MKNDQVAISIEEPYITYNPESLLSNPRKMIVDMFSDLVACRELAWRLALRDINAQYRQTLLGFFWALALPLANTVVWVFLSRTGVVSVAKTTLPYPVYVYVGTMLWAIFMDAVNAPLQSTMAAKPMLAKINFPREAIVVSAVYQTLFNAAIKLFLIVAALGAMGIFPGRGGLFIPVGVFSLILVGTAAGLLITPIGVLYGDVGKVVPLLMQFLMYVTPVVFPFPKKGLGATLCLLNPLTPLIQSARSWVTGQPVEFIAYFIVVNIAALALLLVVWIVYRLAMPILIERMSS